MGSVRFLGRALSNLTHYLHGTKVSIKRIIRVLSQDRLIHHFKFYLLCLICFSTVRTGFIIFNNFLKGGRVAGSHVASAGWVASSLASGALPPRWSQSRCHSPKAAARPRHLGDFTKQMTHWPDSMDAFDKAESPVAPGTR